jgi:hypothetical protein
MRSIPVRPYEKLWPRDQLWMPLNVATVDRSVFTWKDFSRFVLVAAVDYGWLVVWGWYRDGGRSRDLAGQRTYVDLGGVRRRVADSVFELTKSPELVAEAIAQFDRAAIAERSRQQLPEPL